MASWRSLEMFAWMRRCSGARRLKSYENGTQVLICTGMLFGTSRSLKTVVMLSNDLSRNLRYPQRLFQHRLETTNSLRILFHALISYSYSPNPRRSEVWNVFVAIPSPPTSSTIAGRVSRSYQPETERPHPCKRAKQHVPLPAFCSG